MQSQEDKLVRVTLREILTNDTSTMYGKSSVSTLELHHTTLLLCDLIPTRESSINQVFRA